MSAESSDEELPRVKHGIIDLISSLDNNDEHMKLLEKWICSGAYKKDLEKHCKKLSKEKKIDAIVDELRLLLPINGILPTEKISSPTVGENSNCESSITHHVDEFLYSSSELNQFCADNDINQNYCQDCGSRNIKDTVMISHSLSRSHQDYIFNVILPQDCSNMKILDIGSRIGAVLYGAYFHTSSQHIYGVEINKELYDIQKKIVTDFKLDDRVKLINSDIMDQLDVVSASDIVILNNVFEFFENTEKQIEIWRALRQHLKKNCILVTIPSVEQTLDNLDVYEEFEDWLEATPDFQKENSVMYDSQDLISYHEIYLYTVK